MMEFLLLFENKFISIGSLLALVITYLTIGRHIKQLFSNIKKRLSKNLKKQICIVTKIIDWFNYIDINLDQESFNMAYINSLEKEIDFMFSNIKSKNYILKFNKKFRSKALKYYGLKKEYHNTESFNKYVRLNYDYVKLIIGLSNCIHKKSKLSEEKILLSDYWNIMRGNFYKFYGQYNSDWKNVKSGERQYVMTDIENPVVILKLYYGLLL